MNMLEKTNYNISYKPNILSAFIPSDNMPRLASCKETQKSTVDSHYLEVQLFLWNASRYPYVDVSDLQI